MRPTRTGKASIPRHTPADNGRRCFSFVRINRRSRYRRFELAGGTFFLTLLTMDRRPILRSRLALECLWSAYRYARGRRPFRLLGWVVLPDHLHVLVELPPRDDDFSTRMSQLKKRFTKRWLAAGGGERGQSLSRRRQGYRGIWQKRFWQHTCRFEEDVARCLDYIHWNPLKHGYVVQVRDWKASSFRRWARRGWYSNDWGGLTKEQVAGPFGA